jgi:hypothetical protein
MDKVIANTQNTVGAPSTRRSRPVSLVCFLVGFCLSLFYLATPSDAAWTQTNGLYGGVYSLAINQGNPLVLYAGTNGSGVFKTTDGGTTWRAVDTGLGALSLAVNMSSLSVHAGTYAGSLFKSMDGG